MYEAKYKNFKTGDTNHFTIQFCEMRKTFINNDAHHLLKKSMLITLQVNFIKVY